MGDSPDYTYETVVTVIIDGEPTPSEPANEEAKAIVGRYSGTDTTSQTLCSWTITADKIGILHEITMVSDNYAKARWYLSIAGVIQFQDAQFQSATPFNFPDSSLEAGDIVLIGIHSSDGTSIVANGTITGKEVG